MSDLMQKLAMSNVREIMNQTNVSRQTDSSSHMVQEFDLPQAKYNIPQEYLQEQPSSMGQGQQPYLSELPRVNTKPVGNPSVDAIKNSKLPDDIKRLMMEHPISQPQQQEATLSNDLIERATRLMKEPGAYIPESAKSKTQPSSTTSQQQSSNVGGIDYKLIQKMINEAVNNALKQNGLVMESSEKSNEIFSFKVGKHVFEGKVTKIKKLA